MKILVVLPRFPYPLEKGDKLRAYHQIVQLAKRNEVYLFAVSHQRVSDEHRAALEPYCKEIRIVNPSRWISYKNVLRNYLCTKSLQLGYWDSQRARRACKQFIAQVDPDVIYSQMVRTMPLVARADYPKVMDFQDALSLNTERRMEQSKGFWRYVLHFEFKMLRSAEYKAMRIFDRLTIISEADRDAIPHRQSDNIRVVPNGVDLDYFSGQRSVVSGQLADADNAHSQPTDLVFCGNMQYEPNIDAARFLVNEIMPLVWERRPETTLTLAGATPKKAVRELAGDRVTVTGTVPDIRPYYSAAKVFVAPMRIGSGLQNKLLEAMAMGIPCVTTPLAGDTLGAEDGKHLLIGTTAQQLADALLALLADTTRRTTMASEAHSFVQQNYTWDNIGNQLESILHESANRHL